MGREEFEGARIGLSELKKFESRLRTAGEEGIFCRVSIVLSDSDGRDLLRVSPPSSSPVDVPCSCIAPSSVEPGLTESCSCKTTFDGLLRKALLLTFRYGWEVLVALWPMEPAEESRSRGVTGAGSRCDGLEEVELDNCSREGALLRRGLTTLSLGACCRFSRDGERRTLARGTGSLEGRGIPLGLELFVGSIIAIVHASLAAVFKN